MGDGMNSDPNEQSPLLGNHNGNVNRPPSPTPDAADAEQPHQPTDNDEDPEVVEGRNKVKKMLPILGVGIFLAFLDQSVVAVLSGDIGSELYAAKNVSWIATAYFLTMTASQPLYGRLSDVFGRKPCLIFAYIMFAIGSLGCGVANSMASLIAARVSRNIK